MIFPSDVSSIGIVIWKINILTVDKMPFGHLAIQTESWSHPSLLGRTLCSLYVEWTQEKTGLLVSWNYLPVGVIDTKPQLETICVTCQFLKHFSSSIFFPFYAHSCKQLGLVFPHETTFARAPLILLSLFPSLPSPSGHPSLLLTLFFFRILIIYFLLVYAML